MGSNVDKVEALVGPSRSSPAKKVTMGKPIVHKIAKRHPWFFTLADFLIGQGHRL